MEKYKKRISLVLTVAIILLSCHLSVNNALARYITDKSTSYVYSFAQSNITSNCLSQTGQSVVIGSLDQDNSVTINIEMLSENSSTTGYFTVNNENDNIQININSQNIELVENQSQNVELSIINTENQAFEFELTWNTIEQNQSLSAKFVYTPTLQEEIPEEEIPEEEIQEEEISQEEISEESTDLPQTDEEIAQDDQQFSQNEIDLYKSEIIEIEFNTEQITENQKLIFYQTINGETVEFLPDYIKYSLDGGLTYISCLNKDELTIPNGTSSVLISIKYCQLDTTVQETGIIISLEQSEQIQQTLILNIKDDIPILSLQLQTASSILQNSQDSLAYSLANYTNDYQINIYQFGDSQYNLIQYEEYFDISLQDDILTITQKNQCSSGAYKIEITGTNESTSQVFYIINENFVGGINND